MTRKDAESELEFLETSEEAKAAGLRRIRRRRYTGPPEQLPDQDKGGLRIPLETLREELLNDAEFVDRLREKLAA
jgi:hypothetical protein